MGRGLSKLQKQILKFSYKAGALYDKIIPYEKIQKGDLQESGDVIVTDHGRFIALGVLEITEKIYGGHRHRIGQLGPRGRWLYGGSTITPAARAAISRAVRRLEDRGLVERVYWMTGNAGVALTTQGAEVAAGLR